MRDHAKTEVGVIFTREQAPGAWPNGTVVRKANSQPDDGTPDGTQGIVIGSIAIMEPKVGPSQFAYFLYWKNRPTLPVFCADTNNDGTPRLVKA